MSDSLKQGDIVEVWGYGNTGPNMFSAEKTWVQRVFHSYGGGGSIITVAVTYVKEFLGGKPYAVTVWRKDQWRYPKTPSDKLEEAKYVIGELVISVMGMGMVVNREYIEGDAEITYDVCTTNGTIWRFEESVLSSIDCSDTPPVYSFDSDLIGMVVEYIIVDSHKKSKVIEQDCNGVMLLNNHYIQYKNLKPNTKNADLTAI